MTARVPSGSACTVSRRERTLIVSRLPTCSADLLECCARNARGSFGLTQTIPRGATVGVRLHRVNVTFRRPTSGLTQVATANPASMADGATVSSPSVVRPSRISGPGCQAAPERPLFVLWISVDTGITAMPRARYGARATEVIDGILSLLRYSEPRWARLRMWWTSRAPPRPQAWHRQRERRNSVRDRADLTERPDVLNRSCSGPVSPGQFGRIVRSAGEGGGG